MARLELIDALHGANHGLLHQVIGVHQIARPARQSAARPAPERRQESRKQSVHGIRIAGFGTLDQIDSAIDWGLIHEWSVPPYDTVASPRFDARTPVWSS